MKSLFTAAVPFLVSISFVACQNVDSSHVATQKANSKGDSTEPYSVELEKITKDWMTWYQYAYYQVRLAQDFIGYDVDSLLINKPAFLQQLATGKFIAVKVGEVKISRRTSCLNPVR